ncbi:MAG TPA: SDR family oxidoreductase [Candidatus Binataceae bacterium]|nr:SDR family oxidoreductase [Candidatus Binataceae bacterium]
MASSNVLDAFSLEGKAALVIGAEQAVGAAAAVTLAEAGAKVLVASQDPGTDKALKEVAKAVQAANGNKTTIRTQNAAIRADLSATADLAVKELGGLHILVNALDVPAFGPAESADDSAFDRIMENNLKTVWMSCQEASRVMLKQGGGAIVNITSVMAERGVPGAALYCAAKAGVLNLTRALALEWARRGIRVNAIEAGWLDDAASPANKDDEFSKTLLKYLPDNKLIKPQELGGALLYLVSSAAGFVTGESIAVDGGLRARV